MDFKKNLIELFTKVDEKFLDFKLADGTLVQVEGEEIKKDDLLSVIDTAGEKSKAPAGSHLLEDGRTLVVDGEGKITEIIEVVADKQEGEALPDLMALEARIMALEEAMALMIEGMSKNKEMEMASQEKFSEIQKENDSLKKANEILEKKPLVKPTVAAKFEAVDSKKELTQLERIIQIRNSKN